jgi:hypothetical protein
MADYVQLLNPRSNQYILINKDNGTIDGRSMVPFLDVPTPYPGQWVRTDDAAFKEITQEFSA